MTDMLLERVTDEEETTEKGRVAHIVWPKEKLAEAYILGVPIQALCGHVFVPTRDPKRYPVCEKCVEESKKLGIREASWRNG